MHRIAVLVVDPAYRLGWRWRDCCRRRPHGAINLHAWTKTRRISPPAPAAMKPLRLHRLPRLQAGRAGGHDARRSRQFHQPDDPPHDMPRTTTGMRAWCRTISKRRFRRNTSRAWRLADPFASEGYFFLPSASNCWRYAIRSFVHCSSFRRHRSSWCPESRLQVLDVFRKVASSRSARNPCWRPSSHRPAIVPTLRRTGRCELRPTFCFASRRPGGRPCTRRRPSRRPRRPGP